MSINAQLLICAIAAVFLVHEYNTGEPLECMDEFISYLKATPEVHDLIINLFVGCFRKKNSTSYTTIRDGVVKTVNQRPSVQREENEENTEQDDLNSGTPLNDYFNTARIRAASSD